MGFELAKKASNLGGKVYLISGPSNEEVNDENIIIKRIISADEMLDECSKVFPKADICIMSAAVSDFKNKNINEDFDKATEDLRVAVRTLGKVVGKVDVEEILSSIFNDFCIGK